MTNPAGFWRRLLALILDGIIIAIPFGVISYLITGNWNRNDDTFESVVNFVYALIIPIIWHGYTVGKKIMGVRIAKENGEKLGFGTMLMRTFVAALVYVFSFGIALIVSAFMVGLRKDKRALHDLMAGTYVTFDKPQA
ncbi:RDD family protein [Bacillus sp. V59.32b]|uniref:RDD family protein n=1 Tax=Bacillus sp. V59.32b TaxID=1758642 RepID=UPI000E3C2A6C|nr:RDD family protein [Bacillus sp. V59.32b]RFU62242.1 RDD family protein [Bacillus sp. V59.32b]